MKSILIIFLFATALQLSAQGRFADEAKAAREKTNEMLNLTDTTGLRHTGPAPDTITLSITHQTLLPQLMSQQAWLTSLKQPGAIDAAIADVAEKINILLTGYIEPDKIQAGKIQLGKDGKLIVQ